MTGPVIILIGIVLILLGIFIFKKLPGIKLRTVRIFWLVGLIMLIIGIAVTLYKPPKGLLPDGSVNDKGNDDASGLDLDENLEEIPESTLIIDGDRIITNDRVFEDTSAFREYIAASEIKDGFDLVDRYAVYDTYNEVKNILNTYGIEIRSEETAE